MMIKDAEFNELKKNTSELSIRRNRSVNSSTQDLVGTPNSGIITDNSPADVQPTNTKTQSQSNIQNTEPSAEIYSQIKSAFDYPSVETKIDKEHKELVTEPKKIVSKDKSEKPMNAAIAVLQKRRNNQMSSDSITKPRSRASSVTSNGRHSVYNSKSIDDFLANPEGRQVASVVKRVDSESNSGLRSSVNNKLTSDNSLSKKESDQFLRSREGSVQSYELRPYKNFNLAPIVFRVVEKPKADEIQPLKIELNQSMGTHEKRLNIIQKFRFQKYNSTSTLFVDSVMVNSDFYETLKLYANFLHQIIDRNARTVTVRSVDILSERINPLSSHVSFYKSVPSSREVFKFLECLFQSAELTVENIIISMIYVQRFLKNTNITIHPTNWARITLGGAMIAAKVWDDHAVWNVDFCQIFPEVPVSDLNELESFVLESLCFDVSIKASAYSQTYFYLRDIMIISARPWALKPLRRSEIDRILPKVVKIEDGSRDDTSSNSDQPQPPKPILERSVSDNGFFKSDSQAYMIQ
ncbi:hypothetical protein BC833DRAFT_604256 [Globomyces pollinis-pini]|nr:hypothetical protein BC833DRAFT_604256 [Globomyces pollinis-pini]